MKQDGFSLMEVLVTMGVAIIAGSLLITLLVQNNNLLYTQTARVSQRLSINDTVALINESIRQASATATSYTVGSVQYTSGASTLVLTFPSIDTSGSVIPNTYDYVVLTKDSVNPAILRRILYPDATSSRSSENRVLSTALSTISFSY